MKKYIIGALIGFVLSLGVSAHAEVVNMIGKVIDGSFPIKINGKTLINQALTIEGVSYVPTKEFAESLGATVKFDANLGIEVVPTLATAPTQTTESPQVIRYRQVVKELVILGNEKIIIENKINEIKTTHATMDQNVDDLNRQVSEKQKQYDNIVAEKHALEAELFPQKQK